MISIMSFTKICEPHYNTIKITKEDRTCNIMVMFKNTHKFLVSKPEMIISLG